ncbi:MAG: hypothetical protein AAFN70_19155, partial [Planctomycetota bacterium]
DWPPGHDLMKCAGESFLTRVTLFSFANVDAVALAFVSTQQSKDQGRAKARRPLQDRWARFKPMSMDRKTMSGFCRLV